ncbi:MAG: hypothetical protein IJI66_15380 [Erysipelotrichaceae bacterium]|nr:hypothetical protein [Erysipelotrichaceae bacterium]
MFIIIKDRRKLIRKVLEQNEFIYNGIRFYTSNGIYYIALEKGLSFSDSNKVARLEYKKYLISSNENYYQIEIYVYENDEGINDFGFYPNQNFIVAASRKASIFSKDLYLKEAYFYIKDGIINTNFDLSVNGKEYDGFPLKQADVIEYLGLKVIWYEDFLYINHFLAEIQLKPLNINEQLVSYSYQLPCLRENIVQNYSELVFDELREFETVEDKTDRDIIKVILPNMIMSFTVVATSFISFYTSFNYSRGLLYSLVYLLSPLAMLVTGVFLPLTFNKKEKKKYQKERQQSIDDYLKYLDEYKQMIEERIKEYLIDHERSFFSIENLNEEPFYLHPDDEDFLTISLGRIDIKRDFVYHNKIELIEQRLAKIQRRLNKITNYPFHLDLKDKNSLSIITKASDKQYFFLRFLLELSYKHHFDDVSIAIYAKNQQLNESLLSIPHLFYNRKRLTLNSHEQLQELDRLKLGKPLILLMLENSEYRFCNPDIHVICFCDDEKDVYKNSGCIIQYFSFSGKMIAKEIKEFSYTKELFEFERYFHRESLFLDLGIGKSDLSFMRLYNKDSIKENYLKKPHSLKAEFAYNQHELLSFDLHENKHGPHGLIGGSTGSGKSELIISLLLSLCLNYSPEYLNIVLIDYKGGGICESLSFEGKRIPHICAAISNLENDVLERMIIALKKECERRQLLFRKMSQLSGISIMGLDDYLNNDYKRYGLGKIAHLLIVIDEFAELKKENPDLIKDLISISRIGRSLGLHLILATQKPAGNIDEEIWSNSRFKICLKVFEEKDSQDILRCKDGAYLKNPGSFILKIDESMSKAQSIYAKNDINNNDPYEVSVLDNTLNVTASKNVIREKTISEASYFSKLMIETSSAMDLHPYMINFLPPENPVRLNYTEPSKFCFGILDDYINGIHKPLYYDIRDNILIYSSRNKEINSMINTLNENKRRTLIISHQEYRNSCICDCIDNDNEEALIYLFDKVNKDLEDTTILIEDIAYLLSCKETYAEMLLRLIKRSEKTSNNVVALTSVAQINFRLLNSFRNRIMIEIGERSELNFFFAGRCAYKGRSFCYEEEIKSFIPIKNEDIEESETQFLPIIKKIPDSIKAETKEGRYLIGYDLNDREKVFADKDLLICSFDEEALNIYADNYKGVFRISHYDDLKNRREGKDLLWLGPGIYSQRLFVASLKNDLKEDEGLYLHKGKKAIIRRLSNEPGADQI